MNIFANYARYYDLLYRDKPYQEEAEYVQRLILSHVPNASAIVELGCGTGAHAEYLASAGIEVNGVDLSEWMLERAAVRRVQLPDDVAQRLHFSHGDVRDVRLGVRVDAVISLFHVMSYQSENADLQAMFITAREHLRPGGVFIFDVWYGPAVLADRPVVRVKELEDDEVAITRIAQPTLHPRRNLVDVHYRIIACEKKTGCYSETEETHRMRYFFSPEIELLATQAGFSVIDAHEWMSGQVPGFDTWGVCFVCRA
ncbi:type 12 methyltransferase [Sulfuricella denitrificans skB26]|uniref:Type 12 methyltransferase n=1 Tax=Sulfuricella denitrificans (strain DSM 22764 / NBRC 105220 / skB26) TaxID=1163617 RepID=S6B8J2_SULDS|nr:class I SAM-dependent methyltransferase [Sulfuricella denitrificans]BAN36677.1 type 12 methyltransferase [Sulfuricella denitrificans skB26]